MSMPFYVSPEQLMKDRADFARKGIARGRSRGRRAVRRRHRCSSRRTSPRRCTRSARSTTGSRSPRSAATTSSRTSGSPASGSPTCAATPTTGATSPAAAWPTPTPRRSARSSPAAARSPTRSRSSSPRSATRADDDQIYRLTYDGQVADEHGFAVMGGVGRAGRRRTSRSTTPTGARPRRRAPARRRRRSARARPSHRAIPSSDLEVAVLDRTRTQQRKFKRLTAGAARPDPRQRRRSAPTAASPTVRRPVDRPVRPRRPGRPHRHRRRRPPAGGPGHRRAQRPRRRPGGTSGLLTLGGRRTPASSLRFGTNPQVWGLRACSLRPMDESFSAHSSYDPSAVHSRPRPPR